MYSPAYQKTPIMRASKNSDFLTVSHFSIFKSKPQKKHTEQVSEKCHYSLCLYLFHVSEWGPIHIRNCWNCGQNLCYSARNWKSLQNKQLTFGCYWSQSIIMTARQPTSIFREKSQNRLFLSWSFSYKHFYAENFLASPIHILSFIIRSLCNINCIIWHRLY